jgi:hypothetical protein
MTRRAIASYLLCWAFTLANQGVAQDQRPQAGNLSLASTASAAANDLRPAASPDLAPARANVAQALNQLDAFLRTGAPAKSVGWKKYLRWDELVALSQQEQPQPDRAAALLARLTANHAGLDMAPFTRLRGALEEYASAANSEAGPAPAGIAARPVSLQPQGNPNLFGYASHRLAAAGIEDYVDQVTGVHDNILGTELHGTARLTGRTTLIFDENPHAASMRILLGGTAVSRNIGYNGPVTIHTTGVTSVSGQKMIAMTADGRFG